MPVCAACGHNALPNCFSVLPTSTIFPYLSITKMGYDKIIFHAIFSNGVGKILRVRMDIEMNINRKLTGKYAPAASATLTSLGAFVREKRESAGMSQGELSRELGIKQNTLSKIERGLTARPHNWAEMARVLGVGNTEFAALMDMSSGELDKFQKMPLMHAPKRPVDTIPIVGRASAGDADRLIMFETEYDSVAAPPELSGVDGAYAIYVYGTSMEPRFFSGELLFVHPHKPVALGDFCVIQVSESAGECGYIKRFVTLSDGKLLVEQLNPAAQMEFPAESVTSRHLVVGMRRV